MKLKPSLRAFAIAVLVLTSSSVLAASDSSDSASDSSPGVIVKVKNAIERGAKATARGIERGANATARGIKRGANATRNAAHKVADKLTGSSDESASSSNK
jgi:hypothetical protein